MSMSESEAIERLKDHFRVHDDGRPTPYLDEAVSMAIQALEKVQALEENKTYQIYREYLSIGTLAEFREAMFFEKYFMELYGNGLEVANWHLNGDLELLDNFIDEALEFREVKERVENDG